MPSPNALKNYIPDAFYHIYNRGVGKMDIFRDEQDYTVFLRYLKLIFSPVELLQEQYVIRLHQLQTGQLKKSPWADFQIRQLRQAIKQSHRLKVYLDVDLLSYCLMPNHFHLLVYQKTKAGIISLMRRLGSGYSGYFTYKHKHLGPLYQSAYKANHLNYHPELQALLTSRYIETNPSKLTKNKGTPYYTPSDKAKAIIEKYPFSSLQYYYAPDRSQNRQPPIWLNTMRLAKIFQKVKAQPNSIFEQAVAQYNNYTDFVRGKLDFNLEDLRLAYLNQFN